MGSLDGEQRERVGKTIELIEMLAFEAGAAVRILLPGLRGNWKIKGRYLDRMIEFASHSINTAGLLLQNGRELQAAILMRSAYETAVRLFWTFRAKDGWNRTVMHWLNEDIKWANEMGEASPNPGHAERVRAQRQAMLKQATTTQPGLTMAPDFRGILKELYATDVTDGIFPPGKNEGVRHYAQYYRVLSGISHGHPTMVAHADPMLTGLFCPIVAGHAVHALWLAMAAFNPLLEQHRQRNQAVIERVWIAISELENLLPPESSNQSESSNP